MSGYTENYLICYGVIVYYSLCHHIFYIQYLYIFYFNMLFSENLLYFGKIILYYVISRYIIFYYV